MDSGKGLESRVKAPAFIAELGLGYLRRRSERSSHTSLAPIPTCTPSVTLHVMLCHDDFFFFFLRYQ